MRRNSHNHSYAIETVHCISLKAAARYPVTACMRHSGKASAQKIGIRDDNL